jgi:hypothetical protein
VDGRCFIERGLGHFPHGHLGSATVEHHIHTEELEFTQTDGNFTWTQALLTSADNIILYDLTSKNGAFIQTMTVDPGDLAPTEETLCGS